MSEQALELRRFGRIIRRHKLLVSIAAGTGFLLGGAYAAVSPPTFTSKTLVAFPHSAASIATQVAVATSNPVLSAALPHVSPPVPVNTLRTKVQAKSLTAYLISISATGPTAAQAEANSVAIATSYVAYVTSGTGVVSVQAKVFQPATTATGTPQVQRIIIDGLLGGIGGALIGSIVAIAISRRDRRLRTRGEIANSMGLSVLASLPVDHPADTAAWTKLLDNYKPGPTDAWWLRTALKDLGVVGGNAGNGRVNAGSSLTVLSFSSDPGAVALGPQLAAFAASLGIVTTLVIEPGEDSATMAALRTACAAPPSASSRRAGQLRTVVSDGGDVPIAAGTALTVVVVVVDDQAPDFPDTTDTTATLFGVSAGAVTTEQLARIGVAAAGHDREIAGILVADPEPGDRTSGRVSGRHRVSSRSVRGLASRTLRVSEPRRYDPQPSGDPDRTIVFTAIGDSSSDPVTEIRL